MALAIYMASVWSAHLQWVYRPMLLAGCGQNYNNCLIWLDGTKCLMEHQE
jgi:hypothetical protein